MDELAPILMTPTHPYWDEFMDCLCGTEGCNFHYQNNDNTDPKNLRWRCKAGTDKSLAIAILNRYFPEVNIPLTIKYFEEHGGYCDCEIVFNVDPH